MAEIATAVETAGYGRSTEKDLSVHLLQEVSTTPQAIGAAVSAITTALQVDAIWVFTQGGNTAQQVAHYRPAVPIVAFTPDERIYQRMSLFWGVTPLNFDAFEDDREFWEMVVPKALEKGIARPGDTIILTGGHPFAQHGPTNFLKIMRVQPTPGQSGTAAPTD
jgi:pyruvate kinase